jgi:hypothetical protein
MGVYRAECAIEITVLRVCLFGPRLFVSGVGNLAFPFNFQCEYGL